MNAFKVSTVLALLIFTKVGSADSLDTRTWSYPLLPRFPLSGIAYGNDHFVAVGVTTSADGLSWGGTVVTSADGINWVSHAAGTDNPLEGVAYGNGRFVVVGRRGAILESGRIINLTITPGTATGLLSLSLEGPSDFDYTIQTSTDLVSWRDVTKISNAQSSKVILDGLPTTSERLFYRAYSP